MRKPLPPAPEGRSTLSRRTLFAGATTAGALAAAATLVARAPSVQAPEQAPRPVPEKGGGYSLSDHVKRYYQTTQI